MSGTHKICPICQTPNHPNAALCSTCGTTLDRATDANDDQPQRRVSTSFGYDFRHGETDLYEGDLRRASRTFVVGMVVLLGFLMVAGLSMMFAPSLIAAVGEIQIPLFSGGGSDEKPTPSLPTITPAPPSRTPTPTERPIPTNTPIPTREPCMQEVRTTDTGLYDVVLRCGHVSMDVLSLVAEINDLADINFIRPGQVLEIPWPTETPDPNAQAAPDEEDTEVSSDDDSEASRPGAFDEDFDPLFVPTATLPPGIQFHTVVRDENIIVIGMNYNTSVEVLSQLNPEITFSQCEFGQRFGGPRCSVALREGQLVRVPAPTPTPTLSPTPSGSETPTPTPTPTFNAPSLQSPSNRAFFNRDNLITLRWIPTGPLSTNEVYRVRVEDLTEGIVYTAETRETSLVVPEQWQGEGEPPRHDYEWSVSVINLDDPENPRYTTPISTFTWESR